MAERKSSVILELQNRIGGPLRQMRRQIRNATREVRQRFSRVGQSLKRFGAGITALGIGVGYTAQRMISNVADTGDELAKMSRQLGFSIQQLQQWQFVAERQGVSQSTLNQSLQAFSKRLGELRTTGKGALATFLKDANPELEKTLKNTKSNTEALRIYLAALSNTSNKADQAAAASAAFSRAGMPLTRLVDGGFGQIDQLIQRQRELRGGISAKDAQAAERYKDAMADLSEAFAGAKYAVVGGSFDALTKTIKQFTRYIVAHRSDIDRWSKVFAEKLPGRIQGTVDAVKNAAQTIQNLVNLIGGWKHAIIGVIGVLSAPFIAGVLGATVSVFRLVGMLGKAAAKTKGLRTELQAMRSLKLGGLLGKGGLVGAAGYGGWKAGGYINKHFVEGTGVGDAIGKSMAQVMAWMGNDNAQTALANSPQAQAEASKRRADRLTAELQRRRAQIAVQHGAPMMMQSAQNRPGAQAGQSVNGRIHVKIDSEGRARVQSVRSEGPVDLDVDAGLLMFGP